MKTWTEELLLPLLLLGAGFDADAGKIRTPYGTDAFYPLVSDTARICFNLEPSEILPEGKSIEDLFAEAGERNDPHPMDALADKLMEADNYLASMLASTTDINCYREFFDAFNGANFLTFNYDSLLEIVLFRKGHWFPEDGYGVSVETRLDIGASGSAGRKSSSIVLHLHGSLCLRSSEFELAPAAAASTISWLNRLEKPAFKFDPDCISSLFLGYQRVPPDHGYTAPRDRVIAPVPNKGNDLSQAFVRAIYERAHSLVRDSGTLISIGYSFNSHDHASYSSVLNALSASHDRKLIVVSPQATEIGHRIREEFPNLEVREIARTLKGWAAERFMF